MVCLSLGSQPDGFATFAALLLCFASIVSAGAAYAHEGLEQEVFSHGQTKMRSLKSKNEMLASQTGWIKRCTQEIRSCTTKKWEKTWNNFEATLQELHTVSCAELSTNDVGSIHECRLARRQGLPFERVRKWMPCLMFVKLHWKIQHPIFDLDALINAVTETGIGIWAV